jgi:hypothetical protein
MALLLAVAARGAMHPCRSTAPTRAATAPLPEKGATAAHLLEAIDHFSGLDTLHFSPRLSSGPGQRWSSKCCYLVPLEASAHAEWIVL